MQKEISVSFLVMLALVNFACKKPGVDNPGTQPPVQGKKWRVTTIAGQGSRDFVDGPSLSARFAFPADVAVSSDGVLYVTDILNARIRRIAQNQVFTFAGNGNLDIVDSTGKSAEFINPFIITVDRLGNLYTSDENDPRLRKITSDSVVSTYAGIFASGLVNGHADTARFGLGNFLTIDDDGNLFVSDVRNNCIRKISTEGEVTTLAGTSEPGFREGEAGQAQFSYPGGIAVDKNGNVFVADRGNYRIRKISPSGQVSTIAGSGAPGTKDGNANESQFSLDVRDMSIDKDGNLFLADDNRIRRISPQGVVSTIAGSTSGFQDGEGPSAQFNYPNGLGIGPDGMIYVADLNNNRIRKISFE